MRQQQLGWAGALCWCAWLTSAQPALAAITNVRVLGQTSTQAVITYLAPAASPCTVEASESASYVPGIPDLNAGLFAGANQDHRAGSLSSGRQRLMVIGQRRADKASDGKYYSRALQSNTLHYFRITCGADTYEATFRTGNVSFGANYSDPVPVDPNNPGMYAWPTIDWSAPATPDRSNSQQTIIDPLTGVLLRRMSSAGQSSPSATSRPIDSVNNYGGWSSTDQALLNTRDGSTISYTGDTAAGPGDWLLLRMSQFDPYGVEYSNYDNYNAIDAVTLTVRGTASGTPGDDTAVEYCLTVDGVNCTTAVKSQDLSVCGGDCLLGNTAPVMQFWEAPGNPLAARLPKWDLFGRDGTVNYTAATRRVDWVSGEFFNPRWTNGSHILIAGSAYVIESVPNPKQLVLASGPGADLSGAAFSAPNFGLLIRKKNRSANTVQLDFVAFTVVLSHGPYWWDSGAQGYCSDAKVAQTYGGVTRYGYHCLWQSSGNGESNLYWIDPESADAVYLGNTSWSKSGVWNAQVCVPGGGASFQPGQANVLYCVVNLIGGGVGLVEATYTGNNLQAAYGPAPASTRLLGEIGALTKAFTDTNPGGPSFDPAYYKTWTLSGTLDDGYLKFRVVASSQDTLGWEVVFSLATEQVAAAKATHGYWPARGCVQHGVGGFLRSGAPAWTVSTHNDLQTTSYASCGGGPLKTELAADMPATGTDSCPANPFPWHTASAGCTNITVTGDVYDPDPCALENSNRGAAGFLGTFQAARPGDVFFVGSERVQILAVTDATHWVVARAIYGTSPATHAAGASLSEYCAGRRYPEMAGVSDFWNYQADPFGKNLAYSTVTSVWSSHSSWDFNRQVGDNWGLLCAGIGSCFFLRTDLAATAFTSYDPYHPERVIANNPPFAGKTATEYQSTSHLASNQLDDGSWLMDVRPMLGGYGGSATALGSAGRLYKIVRTLNRRHLPTEAFCGDHPLLDSSRAGQVPANWAGLTEAAGDQYKYCVANTAGECYGGSAAGDIYVNCPNVTRASCYTAQTDTNFNTLTDICVFDLAPNANQNVQVTFSGPPVDRYGLGARRLTRALLRHRNTYSYANAKALPDGSWVLTYTPWLDGVRPAVLAAKHPGFSAADSANRATFVPLAVQVGSAPAGADKVVADFGYNPSFECTSRQEACVAVTGGSTAQPVNETTPFYWSGEAYAGVACASGCTLTIPALPQRVLYYRLRYLGPGGTLVATGPTQAVAVP